MCRFLLIILTCWSSLLFSQQQLKEATVAPQASGFSAERLKRVDALIKAYVDSGWINGATALVARNGQIVYHKAIGKDGDKPLEKTTIMRIASQTKAVTSVAVMILFEEGRFLLDDPISKYIPAFKNPVVLEKYNEADTTYTTRPAKSEITIRQLLTHTSGILYAQIGTSVSNAIYAKNNIFSGIGGEKMVLGDMINRLGKMPLAHDPGEKFSYGLNTDVLGYLVEVISGTTLDKFFTQRIFIPLGMKDTYFYLPADKKKRLAVLYTENDQKKAVVAPAVMNINGAFHTNYSADEGTFFSGGGGLASTAYDYAIFMQMLLNNGVYNGNRILSPASVRLMTTNQIGDLRVGKADNFGLGFQVVTEPGSAYTVLQPGSFFWGGMFSSSYWIDPKEKIVAQFFLQLYPNSHGDIHEKFKTLVYQALGN